MKYLVMECHDKYAVLLDEEAGFVKAVNNGLTVGETIENPQLLSSSSKKGIIMKVTYGLTAASACLAVAFGISHYNEYIKPYSNIRLSINPDVELVLNHHGQVLSVEGLNEDGKTLIDGYKPKRKDKNIVADELIDRAIDMGFLSDGSVIVFDIDIPDEKLLTQYSFDLRTEADTHTRQFSDIEIVVREYDEDNEDDDDEEYNDDDYAPIVIPIPEKTEDATIAETKPSASKPPVSDSGYEESNDGDSNYNTDEGDSQYGENVTKVPTTKPPTTVPPTASATKPPVTVPPTASATKPPVTVPPATAAPSNDSNYGDSSYNAAGDSGYEANDSGYDTDD